MLNHPDSPMESRGQEKYPGGEGSAGTRAEWGSAQGLRVSECHPETEQESKAAKPETVGAEEAELVTTIAEELPQVSEPLFLLHLYLCDCLLPAAALIILLNAGFRGNRKGNTGELFLCW